MGSGHATSREAKTPGGCYSTCSRSTPRSSRRRKPAERRTSRIAAQNTQRSWARPAVQPAGGESLCCQQRPLEQSKTFWWRASKNDRQIDFLPSHQPCPNAALSAISAGQCTCKSRISSNNWRTASSLRVTSSLPFPPSSGPFAYPILLREDGSREREIARRHGGQEMEIMRSLAFRGRERGRHPRKLLWLLDSGEADSVVDSGC